MSGKGTVRKRGWGHYKEQQPGSGGRCLRGSAVSRAHLLRVPGLFIIAVLPVLNMLLWQIEMSIVQHSLIFWSRGQIVAK